jgi:hypothetical protein
MVEREGVHVCVRLWVCGCACVYEREYVCVRQYMCVCDGEAV